jgi:hypothetical protein
MIWHLVKGQRSASVAALCILWLLVIAAPTMAYDALYPPNARLMGMGWTWVGVADSPDAACSNPAAFGFNEDEASIALGAGFVGNVKDCDLLYAGICDKDRGLGAGGLAFVYQKTADEGASDGLRYATYRLGKKVADYLSLGAGVGYLKIGGEPQNFLATDIGVMLKAGALYVGIQASGITKSTFGQDEPMKTEFSPEFAIGLSLRPSESFVMGVDVHGLKKGDNGFAPWYSCGAELWLADRLALRCGAIAVEEDGEKAISCSGGVGLKVKQGEIGYAIIRSKDGSNAHAVMATASF